MTERPNASGLRILLVMEHLMRGGLQEVLVLLASDMRRRGHRVTCFTARPVITPNPYLEALERAGIPVVQGFATTDAWAYRLRLSWLLFWLLSPVLVPLALFDAAMRRRSPQRSIRGVYGSFRRLLLSLVREENEYFVREILPFVQLTYIALTERPHLVHGFYPEGVDKFCRWSAALRIPMMFSDHTPYEHEWQPPTQALQRAIPHLGCITVLDESAAERVRRVYGARGMVVVAPQPLPGLRVPAPVPGPAKPSVRFGCLARFDPEKGLAYLLQAMVDVQRELPDAELWLAGAGSCEAGIWALRSKLALDQQVRISGWLAGQDKLDFLANIDVLVLSSLAEGIPMAILEAMAACKPVVATRVGAVNMAVIDGVTGFLVEARDSLALAKAMITLGSDASIRMRMGEAGARHAADRFSLVNAVDSLEAQYRAVVQAAGRHRN